MIKHIKNPSRIAPAGNKPKIIDEFVGRVQTRSADVSIAVMKSPAGWREPAQTPDFDEYTLVLKGTLRVSAASGDFDIAAGECVLVGKGERVAYSTPGAEGAEYVAVCLPAFTLEGVHREE